MREFEDITMTERMSLPYTTESHAMHKHIPARHIKRGSLFNTLSLPPLPLDCLVQMGRFGEERRRQEARDKGHWRDRGPQREVGSVPNGTGKDAEDAKRRKSEG